MRFCTAVQLCVCLANIAHAQSQRRNSAIPANKHVRYNNNVSSNNNGGGSGDEENYKALQGLHAELDDDHDGQVNIDESNDYIKELDVKQENVQQKQETMFKEEHDQQISLADLWRKWKSSPVYKWSTGEVIHWLTYSVQLPEYATVFRKNHVNGKKIPRLSTPQGAYVQKDLRIMNVNHRRKIYLKASDLLLFGAPDDLIPLDRDKSFLAIKAVHTHLDDDSDGKIDADESQEYLDEELGASFSKRHMSLHNTDDHISVDELWETWQESDVYKWDVDQVVHWLKNVVGLPQYEKIFREKKIDGRCIPRIATDKSSFLQSELNMKNPKHRRKIYLKASDIILFGTPEVHRSYFNDTLVAITVVVATLACFYAFREKNLQRKQIEDMTKDLLSLQQAEESLKAMQESLEQRNNSFDGDSSEREKALLDEIDAAKKEAERLQKDNGENQEDKIKLALVEQELSGVRLALAKAEIEMQSGKKVMTPKALQQWLQKTYQLESHNFQLLKSQAMLQMEEAKDACEKVSKAKRSMFGSLRLAHGQTIDMVDQKIINARCALADVTSQLQERQHRWSEIENLCSLSIVTDGLFANFNRVPRRSSLAQALKEVTTLTLSSTMPAETIEEVVFDTFDEDDDDSSQKRRESLRRSSVDSNNDSKSAGDWATDSSQTPTPPDDSTEKLADPSTTIDENVSRNISASRSAVVHRSASEKTFSVRPLEKSLIRVNTEPISLTKKSINEENVLRNKVKSSIDMNGHQSDTASRNSRLEDGESEVSLNFSDVEEESDTGNLSDESSTSAASSNKKKKKKNAFRKLFHRKSKVMS